MVPLATRKDVAQRAGVSEATVSRVFNNIAPLREETKQKVLEAAKELDYHPNAIAQSFAKGKSGNIGVIVPYLPKVRILSTYYFSEILSGIGIKLAEQNYGLLLLFQSPDEQLDYTQLFHSQKVDGCIILGSKDTESERESLSKLHQASVPYCLVNQTFQDEPFYSIDAEHYEGSKQAVTFLIKKGYQNIAFLNGPSTYSNSQERKRGYQSALMEAGIPINNRWIFQGNYSRTSGMKKAQEIAPIMTEIDAIFASNDRMAIGLMQGLNELGYEVGRDYALMGYDDSDLTRMVHPPLSSVKVPLFDMGKLAAHHVLTRLTKRHTNAIHARLPVTIKERASTHIKK
ncbi:LacI family DNA-binding transcriptional regulator [Alkalihalobacillus hemicellulosilyticus]|uniref:Transcriptional regulator n=1 Tax=Halalkalibacter hemicellulosilyticusJCM 9152 TaxID=1236971 RepID=W4QC33_9BACI|nr:LacI family DNA-binding transcriptional regulator [Halalkalibacter hemicellulosilyticus]GAE29621.1 transcriptional regulator [Halalkalibacter hemicellulosilyticusJCM 9152]